MKLPGSAIVLLAAALASCGVPREPDSVHAALEQDLLVHFSTLSSIRVTDVDVSLLRDLPRQSGIADQSYYAWVVLRSDTGQTRSGAVRVVGVEDSRFKVTDFLTRETLDADPAAAAKVFPAELVPEISKRARE